MLSSAETTGQVGGAPEIQSLGHDTSEKRKKFDISQPLPVIRKAPFPHLCGPTGAPPGYTFPNDSLVAAKTNLESGEWILAVIIKKSGKDKYDVVDSEEVDSPAQV